MVLIDAVFEITKLIIFMVKRQKLYIILFECNIIISVRAPIVLQEVVTPCEQLPATQFKPLDYIIIIQRCKKKEKKLQ